MLKTKLRTLLRDTTGYDIHKVEPGQHAMHDLKRLVTNEKPILFDVGANHGQTIDEFLKEFPGSDIHAFEPGEQAFSRLARHRGNATLNNFGLGSEEKELTFFESTSTDMSSFLSVDVDGWGREGKHKHIRITTIDAYCDASGIDRIDVLKTDTQGFDLEVLRGAKRMLEQRQIGLVYIEINFARIYKGQARADEIMGFMFDFGFDLISFYKMHFIKGKSGWTEAIFSLRPQP